MFVHIAPEYFKYMKQVIKSNQDSSLAKILGVYKVCHGKGFPKPSMHVIVMENSNYNFDVNQMYDLKGVMRRRFVDTTEDVDEKQNQKRVLQDGNFMDRIPIPVRQVDLHQFTSAVKRDTDFLCKIGVIDYSLVSSALHSC